MQQQPCPLDMAEESVADTRPFRRALDQAGNVGDDKLAALVRTTPNCGRKVVNG